MKTPVSRVGNKTSILHILYAVFPPKYERFIDVFGGSGSVLGSPYPCNFEVYNDFDRNLVNLFRCMKERTMATIRELGFCNLNSREDFNALREFFESEKFEDKYWGEEQLLTELILPPLQAEEMKEIRTKITKDYDVRRAAMFLKLLRYSYSSGCKSYASQPFDIRRLFYLIKQVESRMANVVVENQDFETLIKHYDRDGAFFYADPLYLSTEGMYEVSFNYDDHLRLKRTLENVKGKFLLLKDREECVFLRGEVMGAVKLELSRAKPKTYLPQSRRFRPFRQMLARCIDIHLRSPLPKIIKNGGFEVASEFYGKKTIKTRQSSEVVHSHYERE